MSNLIDGLPDTVVLTCFAFVPYYLYPKLELVSRSWKIAFCSVELFRERRVIGSLEDFLAICCHVKSNIWQLYDPVHKFWITLPEVPSKIRHLVHFGVVSTSQKMFVIGGYTKFLDNCTTNEVWSFDFITRTWSMVAPMLVSHFLFACCSVDGKIVVAGGYTTDRFVYTYKTEMYDTEKDVWIPLPDLLQIHDRCYSGLMIGGKMHIDCYSSVQVFDNLELKWTIKDYKWPRGQKVVVQDSLYVKTWIRETGHISIKQWIPQTGHMIIEQNIDERDMQVVSSPRRFPGVAMNMVGFRGELYMLGGMANPKSNVFILNVKDEKPTWRCGIPMSPRCYGIVHGCMEFKI